MQEFIDGLRVNKSSVERPQTPKIHLCADQEKLEDIGEGLRSVLEVKRLDYDDDDDYNSI